MKNLAIILAGGSGSRIDNHLPKQFFQLAKTPVLKHTLDKFENHPAIHHIFVVTNAEFRQQTETIVHSGKFKKVINVLNGGAFRQDSSRIGVEAADPRIYEQVLIHDAARPFVSKEIIDRVLEKLEEYQAVNVAIPSTDTIIEVDDNHLLKSVPERKYLRRVQTPQGFKLQLIKSAHRMALERQITNATDDCSLVLQFNLAPVYVVEGSPLNIKITYSSDLQIAEQIAIEKRT
jgi:2-C-methyl-D-erythritol 4-phosphate cytidylyltransferase